MKFLVFTTDLIPLPGLPTSGTALRTWGLAQGLKAHGHEVVISVPKSALSAFRRNTTHRTSNNSETNQQLKALEALAFDAANQSRLVRQIAPDVILCGHWPAMMLSSKPSQPVVIDLAGPHLLERYYQKTPDHVGGVLAKLNALSKADYFIVSGPSQRLYFLSFLLRAEVQAAEERIAVIPMPLSPQLPQRPAVNMALFPNFVFGGVFLPWQDPSRSLRHLDQALRRWGHGRLTLVGGEHPSYRIDSGVSRDLFSELAGEEGSLQREGKRSSVQRLPMLPYDDFVNLLSQCDVAMDLMRWNLERQLAVTIRTTTYLWSGVPVIYNRFSDLQLPIQHYDAGWCLPSNDPVALDLVLEQIRTSPYMVQQKSLNAQRLAKDLFSWDRALSSLLTLISGGPTVSLKEYDITLDFGQHADLQVLKDAPVEQRFVCRMNGLSRLEFRLATHQRRINCGLTLKLYEIATNEKSPLESAEERQRQELAQAEIKPEQIRDNEWHVFDFPRISASAGKHFALRLESEEAQPSQAASLWSCHASPYPLISFIAGEKKIPNTALCFRSTCTMS